MGGLYRHHQRGSRYPYPALLSGTQVLLGGEPLPLYFTSSGQIDAIVPYDITANSTQQVIVQAGRPIRSRRGSGRRRAAGGVHAEPERQRTGLHSWAEAGRWQYSRAEHAANPASVGDYLLIYCTGWAR